MGLSSIFSVLFGDSLHKMYSLSFLFLLTSNFLKFPKLLILWITCFNLFHINSTLKSEKLINQYWMTWIDVAYISVWKSYTAKCFFQFFNRYLDLINSGIQFLKFNSTFIHYLHFKCITKLISWESTWGEWQNNVVSGIYILYTKKERDIILALMSRRWVGLDW